MPSQLRPCRFSLQGGGAPTKTNGWATLGQPYQRLRMWMVTALRPPE
jgi:hypothetical protein